jgi:hypothetical protein
MDERGTGRTYRQLESCIEIARKTDKKVFFVIKHSEQLSYVNDLISKILEKKGITARYLSISRAWRLAKNKELFIRIHSDITGPRGAGLEGEIVYDHSC